MKQIALTILILVSGLANGQDFDFYGPKPFDQILGGTFNKPWTPGAITSVENRKYIVILDEATKSFAISLDENDINAISMISIDEVNGSSSTYGSALRSIFQIVDINTHEDNNTVPLSGQYRVNPFLHSYYAINSSAGGEANVTDGGSFYINEATVSGYLLIEFEGASDVAKLKAVSQWEYNDSSGEFEEVSGWTPKWLEIDGSSVNWTDVEADASDFFLADADDLIDLEIEEGSDFNPLSVEFQPNATAELPEVNGIEESPVISDVSLEVESSITSQLGTDASATTAANTMLDEIETTLTENGASLRYPKNFYLAVRENMLSQKIASTDIYGGKLGYNTVAHVYFTNASDDNGIPHPFMVIASHAVSTRPNQLVDVSRPPGAEQGVGYGESTVTRNGKLGEFLVKIPLKDYGLIDNLLDNDLSVNGDLASDFDDKMGTTTTKDVYNYTSLASIGMAVDGVTIYPAKNNNLRFAVEDGEVTHSGIHVGGGLELHYHADGHAFNGNGINLYNLADYEGRDHPPVIGMAYDGIALFGKYEDSFSAMAGHSMALDEYGGHDHGDGFGYHYHAHSQNVESSADPGTSFDENFLLVGAWRGHVNDIPGFEEGKLDQFKEIDIARYVGVAVDDDGGGVVSGLSDEPDSQILIYPNPGNRFTLRVDKIYEVSVINDRGEQVYKNVVGPGLFTLSFESLPAGIYFLKGKSDSESFTRKIILSGTK